MQKVILFSGLLVLGLIVSQFLPEAGNLRLAITLGTMFCLSFIMIHVGLEFDIDKSKPKQYAWDAVVAATAAAFPWIFVASYFVFVLAPPSLWSHGDQWKESLLLGRFASPTSAGVLFSMLAAAGLAATWVFRKTRILAIFDDLDTILLMIPLKALMVGMKWQLGVIVLFIAVMLWAAWKFLHRVRLPTSWPFLLLYSFVITFVCKSVYFGSKVLDDTVPVHLEVLLPAFVLGCVLVNTHGHSTTPALEPTTQPPADGKDEPQAHLEPDDASKHAKTEANVATWVSAAFMVLVGLSMPSITADAPAGKSVLQWEGVEATVLQAKNAFPGWGWIAFHVLVITVLSNIGKCFAAFCYRREATLQERCAVAIAMFPRGEVGAGVLVVSLGYGLGGPALTVAVLSLALNLLLTGVFILFVRKLILAGERAKQSRPDIAAAQASLAPRHS